MSQMTEASKKRMEEYVGSCNNQSGFFVGRHLEGIRREAYQAGMQDPDSDKELLNECEMFFDQLNKSAFWVPPAMRGVFNHERISGLLNKIREARK